MQEEWEWWTELVVVGDEGEWERLTELIDVGDVGE